jgi:restriction endonuclease Mrr
MAVPDFQTLMLPLLKLASDGQQHTLAEAIEWLAKSFSFLTTTEHNFSEAGRRGCTTASAGQPPTSRRRACSRPLRRTRVACDGSKRAGIHKWARI